MNLKPASDFSYEERKQAVRNHIVACYHNQSIITSYNELTRLLNDGRVEPLATVRKTGQKNIYAGSSFARTEPEYSDRDAEVYYEWLVKVVSQPENHKEQLVKDANDQLFRFLYVMRNEIRRDKNVQLIAPYDWQNLFLSFDERLTDMQRIIDRGDKDTIEVLKTLMQYVKESKTLLKTLCR